MSGSILNNTSDEFVAVLVVGLGVKIPVFCLGVEFPVLELNSPEIVLFGRVYVFIELEFVRGSTLHIVSVLKSDVEFFNVLVLVVVEGEACMKSVLAFFNESLVCDDPFLDHVGGKKIDIIILSFSLVHY